MNLNEVNKIMDDILEQSKSQKDFSLVTYSNQWKAIYNIPFNSSNCCVKKTYELEGYNEQKVIKVSLEITTYPSKDGLAPLLKKVEEFLFKLYEEEKLL